MCKNETKMISYVNGWDDEHRIYYKYYNYNVETEKMKSKDKY